MEKIEAVRNALTQDFKNDIENEDVCDIRDVNRVLKDNTYVSMFLNARENDIDVTVKMIIDTLRWRKTMLVNDITEVDFPKEFFEVGAIYNHSHDLDGNRLLIFRICLHDKNAVEERIQHQFVIYWLETMFWSRLGQTNHKISVLFDMSGAGYSNMDLGLMKFIVTCFKQYYPTFLSYFIIYEMSFIFNAIWEIVKSWLPESSRAKVKFVKKGTIQQFIGTEQLAPHMGGTDEYKYIYSAECRQHISASDSYQSVSSGVGEEEEEEEIMKSARGDSVTSCPPSSPPPPTSRQSDAASVHRKVQFVENAKEALNGLHEWTNGRCNEQRSNGTGPLIISPENELVFTPLRQQSTGGGGGGTAAAVLTLTNRLQDSAVAYKLKTTSPAKYKVRPVSGSVPPAGRIEVTITDVSGPMSGSRRDKFLLQCVAGGGRDVWTSPTTTAVTTYRLHCTDSTAVNNGVNEKKATDSASLLHNVQTMQVQMNIRLERVEVSQRRIMYLLMACCVLLLIQFITSLWRG